MKLFFRFSDIQFRFFALGVLLLHLTGCSVFAIKKQVDTLDNLALIHGKVDVRTTQSGSVNVLLFRRNDYGLEVVRKSLLTSNQTYEFHVVPGSYLLGAFVDANGDGEYQSDEHATYLGAPDPKGASIELTAKASITAETLVITGPIAAAGNVKIDQRGALMKSHTNVGRVASLDEPMFSAENASMGLWRPVDYLNQYGAGLMLLQPYDKNKIPVVFVHGISGSAHSFEKIIEGLNQDEFQSWVLQYPSGLRLDLVSDYLLQALNELYGRYKFPRMMIVGHSMGGLVTQSFMMKYLQSARLYQVALGVTINSPANGMDSAASGVETSPIVVPSWRDLATNSEFVQRLHAWQWPKDIPYHLFFSYLPDEESDGVVPLKSQLSLSLQDQAVAIHGFQNEHTAVLADPEFVKRLTAIMSSYRKP